MGMTVMPPKAAAVGIYSRTLIAGIPTPRTVDAKVPLPVIPPPKSLRAIRTFVLWRGIVDV